MFDKKTIRDIDVQGKKVLVRVDFNVPLKDGVVGDDTRIRAAVPTIKYLLENGAAVILCSHLGRPKGGPEAKYSLSPVAEHLAGLLGQKVMFAEDCIGPKAEEAAAALKAGDVLVLENTRFHPEEEANDSGMARQLASLADVYVNDAFGTAHRAHASTEGITHFLPGVAGFLLEKEIRYLGQTIANPQRPFVAIMGGAKISDKIGVIKNLLKKADAILIGGGMANTFLKAKGLLMADSLVEDDAVATALELLESGSEKIHLPVDLVLADKFDAESATKTIAVGNVPDGWRALDIGPETVKAFGEVIKSAGTVVWNGPMGVFEIDRFAFGTKKIAEAIGRSKAISVIGGGDTETVVTKYHLEGKITHVSTGGGASLEFLGGKELPALKNIIKK